MGYPVTAIHETTSSLQHCKQHKLYTIVLAARNLTVVAWYHASVLCFTRFRKFRTKITTINNEIFILFYFHNENVRFF